VVAVPLKRIDPDPDFPVPAHAHEGDAGVDLRSSIELTIAAGGRRALVPTGVAIAIPRGFAGFIQPRSGLALEHGVTCLNTPGLIDADYRGELKVLLINTDPDEAFTIRRGDRIAQLVIKAVEQVRFVEVDDLDSTVRGEGGFGHTGRT
jgi:dUTP pyrophosphatase